MKVVTSGWKFLDIDAYAGCIAYAELLNLVGQEAIAATTAPTNESVTKTVLSWQAPIVTDYVPHQNDDFVLIDVSAPEFFDKFVALYHIVQVIDHHMEHADYWHDRLGEQATIEFIGAACTLVAEQWQSAGVLDQISSSSARLLMTGILDNTLNFKASVTTERDHTMYDTLSTRADLPANWPEQYFDECQQAIVADLEAAILADLKHDYNLSVIGHAVSAGQLVLWDAQELITGQVTRLRDFLDTQTDEWFLNLVDLKEGASYFVASSETIERKLSDLLQIQFEQGIAKADRLWLRKEIMKRDIDTRS